MNDLRQAVGWCRERSVIAARLRRLLPRETADALIVDLPEDLDLVAELLEKRASGFGIEPGGLVLVLTAAGPAPPLIDPSDGGRILDEVAAYLTRYIAYPNDHARDAHVLWIAHCHLMDEWESTPRLAFLSPEPGSGKTRALEVTELLVPRPVEAVSATPAYLFRKVSDPAGLPTILFDEIDTVFGPRAKDNEEIRAMLNAGHRRGAMAGRCVIRGKTVETEELPAYCAVALAGLGVLPDTILSRSIVIRMQRRGPTERIESFRRRVHAPEGLRIRDDLAAWADAVRPQLTIPLMPPGVEDRSADVWEALIAVADSTGSALPKSDVADVAEVAFESCPGASWPTRARVAAVALVAQARESSPSLGIRLLADVRLIFRDQDVMATADLLHELCNLEESSWGDLRGKPLDSRRLASLLRPYGVHSKVVRIGITTPRGYTRQDLHDAWLRYLGPSPRQNSSATLATSNLVDDREIPF